MFFVSLEELRLPKFLITEEVLLSGPATGERVPLHAQSESAFGTARTYRECG